MAQKLVKNERVRHRLPLAISPDCPSRTQTGAGMSGGALGPRGPVPGAWVSRLNAALTPAVEATEATSAEMRSCRAEGPDPSELTHHTGRDKQSGTATQARVTPEQLSSVPITGHV